MNNYVPIFSISFRPFFLLAALIAIINPILWVLTYLGHINIPLEYVDPLFWHAHEMIFGFSGALIAGFILTASASWTNSKPYQGTSLALLSLVWLIERISYFLPIPISLQFVLMNTFFPVLFIMLFLKLRHFPKQRNVFLPILLGIMTAKFFHSWGNIHFLDNLEISGKEMAIGFVRIIVLLIAGRVIPFFSRKRIKGFEANIPSWANPFALIPIVILAIPLPLSTPNSFIAIILVLAIIGNISRQAMWKPFSTVKVPILFILHIGIAFINIGLILEFLGLFYESITYSQAPLHMLMAGGLGIVGLGIMTRVSLGHTGRSIEADKWTILSYILIAVGSFFRVFIPILNPGYYLDSLLFLGIMWSLGFLVFFLQYSIILLKARPDGKDF